MDKIYFDRSALRFLAKDESDEQAPSTYVANAFLRSNGYALAMVDPDADVSDLKQAIQEVHPGSRILEVTAPETEKEENAHQAFLNNLVHAIHPSLPSSDFLEQVYPTLPTQLYLATDFLIVSHAERLGTESLHSLRRDQGMPPAILIAYDECILITLVKDLTLVRHINFCNLMTTPMSK